MFKTSFKTVYSCAGWKDLGKWMKFEACEENILSAMINRANDILLKRNEKVRHFDKV